ncbi:MAG TPA: DUF488 family protein [Luteimonas sp.]|nr:DUF488 family protein [Luteimonas sp.]
MRIEAKRAYLPAADGDGRRILVDRLWPRGLARAALADVPWVKSVAPSDALRKWFGHEPAKWDEFRRRYFAELDANPDAVAELRGHLARGRNTLLFGARDEAHNNAVALREYLLRG